MNIYSDMIDAKRFIRLLEAAELDVRRYSGRAMYGKECVAVNVTDSIAVGSAVALAIASSTEEAGTIHEQIEALHYFMQRAREDSMGRSIVVYWPQIEWPSDGKETDGDESTDDAQG